MNKWKAICLVMVLCAGVSSLYGEDCDGDDFPDTWETASEASASIELINGKIEILPAEETAAEETTAHEKATVDGCINSIIDVDWFKGTIPEDAPQGIKISTTGGLDTTGELLNSEGERMAFNDDAGESDKNFEITELLPHGEYYIGVRGFDNTGDYVLLVEVEEIEVLTIEEVQGQIDGNIENQSDANLFKITVPVGNDGDALKQMTIFTDGDTVDTTGELLDSEGERMAFNDDAHDSNFGIIKWLPPGEYYTAVRGFDTGVYTLHAKVEEVRTFRTWESGQLITRNTEDQRTVDLFRISIDDELTPLRIFTTGDVDTTGELLDKNGNHIAFNDDDGENDRGLNFGMTELVQSGDYYIAVRSLDREREGVYTLHIESEMVENLAIGGYKEGTIKDRFAVNLFKMEVESDGLTPLRIFTTGDVDTTGELLDKNGNHIAFNDDDGENDRGLNFGMTELVQSGDHYIAVRSLDREREGVYTLHVESEKVKKLAIEGEIKGKIASRSDVDWFKVEIPERKTLIIYTTGNIDTTGELLTSKAERIAFNDDDGKNDRGLNFGMTETLQPDEYYIAVRGFNTGIYTIHAEFSKQASQ